MKDVNEYKNTCNVGSEVTYSRTVINKSGKPNKLTLYFTEGESILRSLTLSGYKYIRFIGAIPDTIEELILDGAIDSGANSHIYNHLPELFPNLKRLVINNAQIRHLVAVPKGLRRLNLARNFLVELPPLPETLTGLIASRNRLVAIPDDLPEGLEILCLGDNYLVGDNVIDMDLVSLQIDWTSSVSVTGKVDALSVTKYLDDTGPIIKYPVRRVSMAPSRIAAGVVPCMAKELSLSNASEDIPEDAFINLHNLDRITGPSKYKDIARSVNTRYIVDNRFENKSRKYEGA